MPVRVPFLQALARQVPVQQLLLPLDSVTTLEEAENYFRPLLPTGRPYILVGYSYTGPVAIRLAAQHPPGLAGLGLLASFARLHLPAPRPLLRAVARPFLFRFPVPDFVVALLAGCRNPWVVDQLQTARKTVPAKILAARLRACFDIDVRDELKQVSVPILNVMARNDSLLPGLGEKEISRLRPDARTEETEGGHALLECTPQQTADILTQFALEVARQHGARHDVQKLL